MAKNVGFQYRAERKRKRKGIHSKNKSRTKGGKQYKKRYNGQGR